jgi:hypothetical protein
MQDPFPTSAQTPSTYVSQYFTAYISLPTCVYIYISHINIYLKNIEAAYKPPYISHIKKSKMLVPALIATKLDPGGDALHRRAALEVLASLVPW